MEESRKRMMKRPEKNRMPAVTSVLLLLLFSLFGRHHREPAFPAGNARTPDLLERAPDFWLEHHQKSEQAKLEEVIEEAFDHVQL